MTTFKSKHILLKFLITSFLAVAPCFDDNDVKELFAAPLEFGVNKEKLDFFSLALISSVLALLPHCSLLCSVRFLPWLPPSSAKTVVLAVPDIKHDMAAAATLMILHLIIINYKIVIKIEAFGQSFTTITTISMNEFHIKTREVAFATYLEN